MQPNKKYITIGDNLKKIEVLLQELVLLPRIKALEWSKITKQTPNMKIGYPGQHLASLITGIEGARTGARGDDLLDGTEVKSCSRIDQLDTCSNCENKVLRIETKCAHCDSENIKRMDDSKWLFSVKTEKELKLLTKDIDRIFLTIGDYPNFSGGDFDTIRFQAFELWNNEKRHEHFSTLMSNYYTKIFLEHIKLKPSKTPAPKNFWPYSFQFYLCNPVKVFDCHVLNANTNPSIRINHFIEPNEDRRQLQSELMPIAILNPDELRTLSCAPDEVLQRLIKIGSTSNFRKLVSAKKIEKQLVEKAMPFVDEIGRSFLKLRDTDVISHQKVGYSRR